MNNAKKTKDLPAILFPHSYLPESILKKILSFFGPLTIFQPWFMERPIFGLKSNGSNAVQVMHPPSELKPGEDFRARLSEYRYWIENNLDKGYTEFLKASQEMDLTENTTWEIRQMLRQKEQGVRSTLLTKNSCQECRSDPNTTKWHLVLHLAQDMEDQRLEAGRMLKALKEKDVPLRGIVEESEDVRSLLEDLPPFESEPIVDEKHLRQIFEAWFALFGGYLKGNELLATSNRHVMEYVSDLWKESRIEDQAEVGQFIRFKFPDLSHYPLKDLAETKRTDFNDDKIRELKNLILDFGKSAIKNLSKLQKLSKEVEKSCPRGLSEGTLEIMVKHLPPIADKDHLKTDSILKDFMNKTIVLVENASHHERREIKNKHTGK